MDRDHPDWDSAINSLGLELLQQVATLRLDFQHEDTYEFRDKDSEIWVRPHVGYGGISAREYKSQINYNVQPFMDLRVLPFRQVTVTRQVPIGCLHGLTNTELSFCEGLENNLLGNRHDWVMKRRHHGFIRREGQQDQFSRSSRIIALREESIHQAFLKRMTICDQGVDLIQLALRWQDRIEYGPWKWTSP